MAYQSVPLTNPWDIRLLHVLPGEDGGIISCVQRVFPTTPLQSARIAQGSTPSSHTANPPNYFALSYFWGDPSITRPIILNNNRVNVTDNLYQFLSLWRRTEISAGTATPLWIDALCINQEDLNERNHQVRRMKTIYESASRIIVWLGPAEDESDLAMAKISSIDAQYNSIRSQLAAKGVAAPTVDNNPFLELLVREDVATHVLMQRLPTPYDGNPWPALRKFFARPWWRRAWIVQEATTQVDTTFICGGYVSTWRQILIVTVVLFRLAEQPFFVELSQEALSRPSLLSSFERQRNASPPPFAGVVDVLRFFSSFEATDERDKIFAALPLSSEYTLSWDTQIDYGKSLRNVIVDVTKQVIISSSSYGHRLDILGLKPEGDPWLYQLSQLHPQLPSWTPDLRRCTHAREPLAKYLDRTICGDINRPSNLVYSASGRTFPQQFRGALDFPLTRISGDRLTVTGFMTSTVTRTVGAVATTLPGTLGIDAIDEYGWRPQNPDELYFTGETMYEAYLRTIVTDLGYGANGKGYRRGHSMEFKRTMGESKVTLGPVPKQDRNFSRMKSATERRILIYTTSGLMGLAPAWVRRGDQIFVVLESQVLHLLRPVSTHYQYIGECYIHGHMDGSVLAAVPYLAQFRTIEIR